MALRHSNENFYCGICNTAMSKKSKKVRTNCEHTFHENCLVSWTDSNSNCPICRRSLTSLALTGNSRVLRSRTLVNIVPSDGPSTSAATRATQLSSSQAIASPKPNTDRGSNPLQQELPVHQSQLATNPPQNIPGNTGNSPSSPTNIDNSQNIHISSGNLQNNNSPATSSPNLDETRIKAIVSAVVSARQASIFGELESRMSQIIESKLEGTLTEFLNRLDRNGSLNAHSQGETTQADPNLVEWPTNMPDFQNLAYQTPPIQNARVSDTSSVNNAAKLVSLVNNWDLKYDGSKRLPVERFIYRVECLVQDSLKGDFNLLCEQAHCLFTKDALDWYFRFRPTVNKITWPALRLALIRNFSDHQSDTDVKELMRTRKQGPNETFDDFRNSIYKIAEGLQVPMPDQEMAELLLRGLRPRLRQQLVFHKVSSTAELRRLCLQSEALYVELFRCTNSSQSNLRNQTARRHIVNEIENDITVEEPIDVEEVIKRSGSSFVCWNCRETGHKYFDCLAERTVFCYGCGKENTYKPTCPVCSGNLQAKGGAKKFPPTN